MEIVNRWISIIFGQSVYFVNNNSSTKTSVNANLNRKQFYYLMHAVFIFFKHLDNCKLNL